MLLFLTAFLFLGFAECHEVQPRSVIGDRRGLWPNGVIYHSFHDSVSGRLRAVIREAMNQWEDKTCVHFREIDQEETDYVEFTSEPNKKHCTTNSIGRRGGGKQVIVLGYTCQDRGELLHLLGHVLGLWNEQARPDRDRFVRVRRDAVEPGREFNLQKRGDFSVGYEGVGYDFGSIMHLSRLAFSADGTPTTEVLNTKEYRDQGSPQLGQRVMPSKKDVLRVKRLYHCAGPGPGQVGRLRVLVQRAVQLTITDYPRVEVMAVDTEGAETTLSTRKLEPSRSPDWDEMLTFPDQGPLQWQFFRIALLGATDTPLAMPLTVPIVAGKHFDLEPHCINANPNCMGKLLFQYEYQVDVDDCANPSNPCMHGGACTDGFFDFTCACPRGRGGKRCEIDESGDSCSPNPCVHSDRCVDRFFDYDCVCRNRFVGKNCEQRLEDCISSTCHRSAPCEEIPRLPGFFCNCPPQFIGQRCESFRLRLNLTIRIINANVEDRDFATAGDSDPYVEVWAFGQHHRTHTIGGSNSPRWDRTFHFGCVDGVNDGVSFSFLIHDDDELGTGSDDRLSGHIGVNFGGAIKFPHSGSSSLGDHPGKLYYEVNLIRDLVYCN